MSDRSRKTSGPRFGVKAGLALAAAAIALGLCELGARMAFPKPPDGARQPHIVHLYDPDIRYVMAPGQQGWIEDAFITVNALGFRGPEVAVPKPTGRFRVAAIGDSLTLGWGVADNQTYAAMLERLLRERFPARELDVVNLGIGGFNTRQAVTWLERNVARLAPDLVLVGFYSNDVPDALEDEPGGTRIAAANPVAGQAMRMNVRRTESGWVDRTLRKSRAVYVAGRAVNRLRGAGEWGMSRFSMELDMLQGKDSAQLDRAWSLVGKQFDRLQGMARADGFAVGVVILPCREQVMGEYLSAKYQSRVRDMAQRLGFHVVDPLPVMSAGRKSELYVPYDRNHPSAEGHALIAQAIARYLEEHRLVAPRPDAAGE